jgi:hypothetical protein
VKRTSTAATPHLPDLLASTFSRRKFERELEVCKVARRVLWFCRYRRAPEHICYARPSSRPDVLGLRRGHNSFFVVDLAHPMRWYQDIYRRGLGGASGHFVFEALEESGDGAFVVLAARQGGGCSLRLAHALARPERGSWRLEWSGVPARYGSPVAPPPLPAGDYYRAALRDRVRRDVDDLLSHHPAGS